MLSAFVGNLPPTISEAELGALAARHGAVISVRLPRDRQSGKLKPFGFIDLADAASLHSVVQALNGMMVHGNALRVDVAGSEKKKGGGGGGFCGGGGGGGGFPSGPAPARSALELLSAGTNADPRAMSEQILNLSEEQLWEIVSQTKALIEQDAAGARAMLVANPAIGLAVLKAQIRLGMVTVDSISSVLAAARPPPMHAAPPPMPFAPPPMPFAPPAMRPAPPPAMRPPPPPAMRPAPPQALHAAPPPPTTTAAATAAPPPDSQAAMIAQVMALTPQQIAVLPPEQRAQIEALRQQFGGGVG